jgi:hypothetical protein
MTFERAGLYIDAARRMRPRQLAWRTRRLIPPRLVGLGIDRDGPVSWRPLPPGLGVSPAPQSGAVEPPHRDGIFRAVGRSRRFPQPGFWTDGRNGLLFLFHLHGFEDLAVYAGSEDDSGDGFWQEVLESWLTEHPAPRMPSWHPFPTSLRLVSWCAAISNSAGWPPAFKERLAREIRREARYLRRCVEHDIGGNHVLKNGVALALSGTLLGDGPLQRAGLKLLRREVPRQFLADGGHEERSTSYHRVAVADLEDLRRALGATPRWLDDAIAAGRRWTESLAGPDGRLPLLNDAWEGPPIRGERAKEPLTQLQESGYVVFRHGDDQAVVDVGPLCPPHLPPHGHADALSFVFWGDGRPVVVDPGAAAYTGPLRNRFRATAAHNTVEVDGQSQCVLWGDFRLARLPTVRAAPPRKHASGVITVAACHDGYRRLEDPVVHQREFVWWPAAGVVVVDRIQAGAAHRVRTRLHFPPELGPRDGPFIPRPVGKAFAMTLDDLYSPHVGVTRQATSLEQALTVQPRELFGWSLLREGSEVVSVTASQLVLRRDGDEVMTLPLDWI